MDYYIGWEDLPQDLIILLTERLMGITSFVRVSAVCSYWHSIFMANNSCYKQVPWLMLAGTDGTDIREFYDIAINELYEFPLPSVQGKRIVGSAHGWLVTAGMDSQFHMFNPLKGIRIALPPHDEDYIITNKSMKKATLSPTTFRNGCIVMSVYQRTDCLSFCRSVDIAWKTIKTNDYQSEVVFIDGKFYSIDCKGTVYACEINPTPKLEEIVSVTHRLNTDYWNYYMVECGGELLVVMICINFLRRQYDDRQNFNPSDGFKVLRLDLESKMAVEIKSIGDYALFLGRNNSICVPTTSHCKMCRRNCIYYTDDYPLGDFGYFEVGDEMAGAFFSLDTDQSYQRCYSQSSWSFFSTATWFTPNPW